LSFILIKCCILDRLLASLFNNNTKKLMDNLSNESSTNSSGFHSKSTTTTTFNNEYSPRLAEITDCTFSGIKNGLHHFKKTTNFY
jgi:hypothetical protein